MIASNQVRSNLFSSFTVINMENFLLYKNKRLTAAVTKTLTVNVSKTCVMHCLATAGCLAVNYGNNSCELTSGVHTPADLIDNESSVVMLVTGKLTSC